jgi:hypothetical protein
MLNDDDDEIIPPIPEFGELLGLILLFLVIGYLVIYVCYEDMSRRLDKHSVVKINWLVQLNDDTLHIHLNIKSNSRTLHLFQCMQALECKWYLYEGYLKRSNSFEIAKLKRTTHMYFDLCQKKIIISLM